MSADPLPILDQSRLDELAGELDSRAHALDFAARFLDLLPRRIHSIVTTVEAGEAEAAHVALLSLAVSAAMVGALQLERDARLADQEIRAGRLIRARDSIPRLGHDAQAVTQALAELLGRP